MAGTVALLVLNLGVGGLAGFLYGYVKGWQHARKKGAVGHA